MDSSSADKKSCLLKPVPTFMFFHFHIKWDVGIFTGSKLKFGVKKCFVFITLFFFSKLWELPVALYLTQTLYRLNTIVFKLAKKLVEQLIDCCIYSVQFRLLMTRN